MKFHFFFFLHAQNAVKVAYEEVYSKMTAKADGLMLTRKQNGMKLVCQFTDIHGNVSKCESNEAVVNCKWTRNALRGQTLQKFGKLSSTSNTV